MEHHSDCSLKLLIRNCSVNLLSRNLHNYNKRKSRKTVTHIVSKNKIFISTPYVRLKITKYPVSYEIFDWAKS